MLQRSVTVGSPHDSCWATDKPDMGLSVSADLRLPPPRRTASCDGTPPSFLFPPSSPSPLPRYRVAYPMELRLFNTTDDAVDGDRLYDLVAVVVHVGSRQVLSPPCCRHAAAMLPPCCRHAAKSLCCSSSLHVSPTPKTQMPASRSMYCAIVIMDSCVSGRGAGSGGRNTQRYVRVAGRPLSACVALTTTAPTCLCSPTG